MSKQRQVRIHAPDEEREFVVSGSDEASPLSTVLARHDVPLNTRCGGRGVCAGCEVHVLDGRMHALTEAARADADAGGQLRACQWRLGDSAEYDIVVPARSLLRHQPSVVSDFRVAVPWGHDPLRAGVRYGAAVDVGTTTVVVVLCHLESGEVAATASAFNAQIRFGEDVLTRIQLCASDKAAVRQLQRAVTAETIQPLLERACSDAGITVREVGVITVAGNTTMQHLFAGADPSPLGIHPFSPVFLERRMLAPRTVGLDFGDARAELHLLPSPAAFVGADIAAGIIATGLVYDEGPSLLIDVGTNGEIVAKTGDRLLACATAAGPAFEGVGLFSGVRAVHGAIERLRIAGSPLQVQADVIDGVAHPIGICGSAYIDFLWEARRCGLLLPSGRFAPDIDTSGGNAAIETRSLGKRLRVHPGGDGKDPVWITELDVSRLLQAKAAIAAGIETLLDLLGTTASQVKRLYLAGGFGMHLSIEHAIGCGLLPGFKPEQIQVVGNTAVGGAFLALNDRSLLEEMVRICQQTDAIELNLQPGFEDAYIDNLQLS